ncbi:MAG TPA: vitamin B12-dependent ribonucleotide reductase [bacterium]
MTTSKEHFISTSYEKTRRLLKPRERVNNHIFQRYFTKPGVHPYDGVEWDKRIAMITSDTGEVIFEQKDVEMPVSWSQTATNIVVSKYFHGPMHSERREKSLKTLINRVAVTIADWGRKDGYFLDADEADTFEAELIYLLLHQKMAFNSPVWFNVGIEKRPQCSACFINSVEDSMESILGLAKTEGMLFKFGSGTGTNLSSIRSSREQLASGGWASGPVSFMRGFDAFAGVIKSGGKTRRAAKMVILNADHPDIRDFINCKSNEEKKAWKLIDAGYDGSLNGEAYSSVFYQNSNNSVRVTDDFMKAVINDNDWATREIVTGKISETHRATDLWREIAQAAHVCGDPGLQFDTTINNWHPCPKTGRINSSNPCSEYMFLDDTACNLASLNLLTFINDAGEFDTESFKHAVRITILAQEILVDNASYPNMAIEVNSHNFRPLGLGYANLGALLMSRGLPYDSDEGRDYSAAVTALMCGEAYYASALISERIGPFPGYAENEEPFLKVMQKHRNASRKIEKQHVPPELWQESNAAWDRVCELGETAGFRNAQATVLAPTGTIGFMMDCDTTGVEPDIALVKYKKLVGGGVIKIVNQTVPLALENLGYDTEEISNILEYIEENDTIEGADDLKLEHLPVFDCAFKPLTGSRSIHHMGHVRMMAAVQPFLSGAISKTVNMPGESTVEDIMHTYEQAWRLGLKSIAIYRDGCKRTQPLSTSKGENKKEEGLHPFRRRLPDERRSITHKFEIAGAHEGYITVGLYDDGSPGEIFVTMAKEGSTISGLMDTIATMTSIMLQYGVPLEVLVNKFSHMRFEPSGFTKNPDLRIAKSIVDYIYRWLGTKFLKPEDTKVPSDAEPNTIQLPPIEQLALDLDESERRALYRADGLFLGQEDAPSCHECGAIMVRNGACYRCFECGATSGCS